MAISAEKQKLIEDLRTAAQSFVEIDSKQLIRTEQLGQELDFREIEELIAGGKSFYSALLRVDLSAAPYNRLQQVAEVTGELRRVVSEIRSFSIRDGNPQDRRRSLCGRFDENFNELLFRGAPLSFMAQIDPRIEEAVSVAKAQITIIDEASKKQLLKLAEVEATLDKARDLVREAAIEEYATYFRDEAQRNRRIGWLWLAATALAAGCTIWYAVQNANEIRSIVLQPVEVGVAQIDGARLLGYALSRLVVFSILLTGVIWIGRTYRSFLHNYVVNRHRENAFNSFTAFVKAAGNDQQTKNAVLIQATQSIFAPQNTGFSGEQAESAGNPQIIELVKGISPDRSSGS